MSRFHHTPEWAVARALALDRDAYRCRECGRAGRMQVHHVVSLKDAGTHDLENLVSYCREHHLDAHRQPTTASEREWADLLSELMK